MSADIVGDLRRAEAARDLLAKAMWDARTELGFDPDGDDRFHSTDWKRIARQHVIEAIQQRTDSEVAIEEVEAERDALRAQVERVRALADEWPTGDNGQEYRRAVTQCANAIRDALDPQ